MPCQLKDFPCKYLGLPLSFRRITRIEVQPVIDKIGAKLPAWKGKLLDRAGRLTLIRSVLTLMPIYFLSVFSLQKWALKKIDRMGLLWKGSDSAQGGHCLVRWKKAVLPKSKGGLGILNLDTFSRALRLWWLWYEWNEPDRPWVGSTTPCSNIDRQLFRASTVVTVGDGTHANFWHCS